MHFVVKHMVVYVMVQADPFVLPVGRRLDVVLWWVASVSRQAGKDLAFESTLEDSLT